MRDKPARLNPQWNVYLARTIEVSSYPEPPANVFGIQFLTPTFTREEGEQTPTYDEHSAAAYDVALSLIGWLPEDTVVLVHRTRKGHYVILSAVDTGLVELCAQETATRNTPYTALLGTWNSSEGIWCYDDAPTVTAIDHRYGMPLAETGSKGLYQAMPSSVEGHNGTLYVCVSLDCEAPPEGCNECEEA